MIGQPLRDGGRRFDRVDRGVLAAAILLSEPQRQQRLVVRPLLLNTRVFMRTDKFNAPQNVSASAARRVCVRGS
jgi:hypothetical protein